MAIVTPTTASPEACPDMPIFLSFFFSGGEGKWRGARLSRSWREKGVEQIRGEQEVCFVAVAQEGTAEQRTTRGMAAGPGPCIVFVSCLSRVAGSAGRTLGDRPTPRTMIPYLGRRFMCMRVCTLIYSHDVSGLWQSRGSPAHRGHDQFTPGIDGEHHSPSPHAMKAETRPRRTKAAQREVAGPAV